MTESEVASQPVERDATAPVRVSAELKQPPSQEAVTTPASLPRESRTGPPASPLHRAPPFPAGEIARVVGLTRSTPKEPVWARSGVHSTLVRP